MTSRNVSSKINVKPSKVQIPISFLMIWIFWSNKNQFTLHIMTCMKITESQSDQIYPEDTFSHGAAQMFTIFLWRFKVTVTSQSDVPIFSLFEAWKWSVMNSMNCLICWGNFTGDMLNSELRHWLWILKRLHKLQIDVCTWKSNVRTKMKILS